MILQCFNLIMTFFVDLCVFIFIAPVERQPHLSLFCLESEAVALTTNRCQRYIVRQIHSWVLIKDQWSHIIKKDTYLYSAIAAMFGFILPSFSSRTVIWYCVDLTSTSSLQHKTTEIQHHHNHHLQNVDCVRSHFKCPRTLQLKLQKK